MKTLATNDLVFATEQLILRPLSEADHNDFAVLNADPQVMHYFPAPLTREQSDGFADHEIQRMKDAGYGIWVVELKENAKFIGVVMLKPLSFTASFTPAIEVGWRFMLEFWGKGYATQAAAALLEYGFMQQGLQEILAITYIENRASRRVMEKLGFRHNPAEDFDHPRLPQGHWLSRHVLYRLSKDTWTKKQL